MGMESRPRYEVYVWHGKKLNPFEDLKQAVDLATKYSSRHAGVVIVWDWYDGRACAYGYAGKGWWTSQCKDCDKKGCSKCHSFGFFRWKPVDWQN